MTHEFEIGLEKLRQMVRDEYEKYPDEHTERDFILAHIHPKEDSTVSDDQWLLDVLKFFIFTASERGWSIRNTHKIMGRYREKIKAKNEGMNSLANELQKLIIKERLIPDGFRSKGLIDAEDIVNRLKQLAT